MLSKGLTLIFVSMIIFGILNLIENIIHYNIGRNYENNDIQIFIPNFYDFIKILFVMIIFGLAQGLLTEYVIKD